MLVGYNATKYLSFVVWARSLSTSEGGFGNQLKITGHLFTAAHIVQDQLHHSLSLKPIYDAQKTQVESDGVTAA